MPARPLLEALTKSRATVRLAAVVAVVLGVARLGSAPLWFDETYTSTWVGLPWLEMVHVILRGDYGANHLPLYFLLLKAWTGLAGQSPFALRLPSVLFHALSVFYVAAFARSSAGSRAEVWAAWFAALSPFMLHHAHEARMYTMLACLCAMSLAIVARYLAKELPGLPLSYLLVNLALLETHHYAVIFVFSQGLALALTRPRDWVRWLPAVAASAACALVPLAVALLVSMKEAGAVYEIGWLAVPGSVWVLATGYALVPTSIDLHGLGLAAIGPFLPAIVVGAIASGILFGHGIVSVAPQFRVLLVAVPALALLGPFAATLLWPEVSFNPRYASIGLAPMLVIVARACSGVPRPTLLLAITALASLALVSTVREAVQPGYDREDLASAGAWLANEARPGETVLVTSEEMATLARFHWPDQRFRLYPERGVTAVGSRAAGIATSLPFDGPRALYVIGRAWLTSPDASLQHELRTRYRSCGGMTARGVEVLCLLPPPSKKTGSRADEVTSRLP
jgi:Dolichyl-phosphate-mannose-protein mannosyltransferase